MIANTSNFYFKKKERHFLAESFISKNHSIPINKYSSPKNLLKLCYFFPHACTFNDKLLANQCSNLGLNWAIKQSEDVPLKLCYSRGILLSLCSYEFSV